MDPLIMFSSSNEKKYDLDSWMVFIDSIKVFDYFHHALLFILLKKFGFYL